MRAPFKSCDSLPDSAHVRLPMNTAPLVDAATVAAQLGLAKSSVYRMSSLALIPSYPVGPKLTGRRFDLAEVRAALKALAQQSVKP